MLAIVSFTAAVALVGIISLVFMAGGASFGREAFARWAARASAAVMLSLLLAEWYVFQFMCAPATSESTAMAAALVFLIAWSFLRTAFAEPGTPVCDAWKLWERDKEREHDTRDQEKAAAGAPARKGSGTPAKDFHMQEERAELVGYREARAFAVFLDKKMEEAKVKAAEVGGFKFAGPQRFDISSGSDGEFDEKDVLEEPGGYDGGEAPPSDRPDGHDGGEAPSNDRTDGYDGGEVASRVALLGDVGGGAGAAPSGNDASKVDNGYKPRHCFPAAPGLDPTYCDKCRRDRPARAHHCKACGVCVMKMDHHCPLVGNCIGRQNLKFFIVLNWWQFVGSLVFLLYPGGPTHYAFRHIPFAEDGVQVRVVRYAAVLWALGICVISSKTFLGTLWLAAINTTAVESLYTGENPYRSPTWTENLRDALGPLDLRLCLPLSAPRDVALGCTAWPSTYGAA